MTPIDRAREAATLKAAEVLKACFEFGGARPVREVVGEILAAYDANLASEGLVVVSGWSQIETAPKDGREILLTNNVLAAIQRVSGNRSNYRDDVHIATWVNFTNGGAAWVTRDRGEMGADWWMPVPDPPSPHHMHKQQSNKPEAGEEG